MGSPTGTTSGPPPDFTFSTGQTMQDLLGLREIGLLMDDGVVGMIPPVLTNPNYIPEKNSKALLVVSILSIPIGILMVSLRVWYSQRYRTTRLLYIEDFAIILGLMGTIGLCGFAITGCLMWQWGWHSYDVTLKNCIRNWASSYYWFNINMWTAFLIRASLTLTIRRMYTPLTPFNNLARLLVYTCDTLMLMKMLLSVSGSVASSYICGHNTLLDIYKYTKTCNGYPTYIAVCAIGILVDITMILLPMPLLIMLGKDVTRRRKVELGIMFSLGFLSISSSAVRLVEFGRILGAVDRNWVGSYLLLSSVLDLILSLCTSCIPSARVLFSRIYSDESLFSVKAWFRERASSLVPGQNPISSTKDSTPNKKRRRIRRSEKAASADGNRPSSNKSGETPRRSRQEITAVDADENLANDIVASESKRGSHIGSSAPVTTGSIDDDEWTDDEQAGEEEWEDGFGMMNRRLYPPDSFFPWATALSPRPTAGSRSKADEECAGASNT